jgi:hypothetical protein
VWWNAQARGEALERVLREHARSLSQAVDRDIRAAIAALETLRHSAPLVAGDIGAFSEVARRVHADNPHWLTVALNSRDGQQVMNLAAEPGQALPNVADYEVLHEALAGRPAVSALFVGRVRNVPLVSIQVPVTIDGEVRYTLATSLSAGHFQSALDSHPISPGGSPESSTRKGPSSRGRWSRKRPSARRPHACGRRRQSPRAWCMASAGSAFRWSALTHGRS